METLREQLTRYTSKPIITYRKQLVHLHRTNGWGTKEAVKAIYELDDKYYVKDTHKASLMFSPLCNALEGYIPVKNVNGYWFQI